MGRSGCAARARAGTADESGGSTPAALAGCRGRRPSPEAKTARQCAMEPRPHECKHTSRHNGHSSGCSTTAARFFAHSSTSSSSSASAAHVRGSGWCSGDRGASGRLGARISGGGAITAEVASPRSCLGSNRSTLVCVVTRRIRGGLGVAEAQHEKASKHAMKHGFAQARNRAQKPYRRSVSARPPPSPNSASSPPSPRRMERARTSGRASRTGG